MQIWNRTDPPSERTYHGAVVTLGNFDGLHLGHQELLKRGQALAGPRVVITFDPHPMQVLHPERHLRRLFPREDLSERLPAYGVDLLVILPFTAAFAELPAEEFLRRYLAEPFEPRHVVAGYDVGFGKGRQGSLASLRAWASPRGVEVHAVAPLKIRGEIVSSRRVRELVTAGQVDEASELLGRPFYLRGPVVAGHGRGARIGVPTLNQQVINETLPLQGVYVTRTRLDGVSRPSVTNIGFNPTFGGETEVKVETHVLDAEVQARGRIVDVDFLKRLRPEMKFPGVEDLKKQIQDDILKARQYLGSK